MAKKTMNQFMTFATWLVVIGGLVHGITAITGSNILVQLLGDPVARFVMGVVGIGAVFKLAGLFGWK
jgi:uncharacterized membrane protein YuzA (DUF378 family)